MKATFILMLLVEAGTPFEGRALAITTRVIEAPTKFETSAKCQEKSLALNEGLKTVGVKVDGQTLYGSWCYVPIQPKQVKK